MIIDEAQCVKNKGTKAAQGAFALQALTRFCMSGTPMMNNVGELFSLIHFLRIKPYNEAQRFSSVCAFLHQHATLLTRHRTSAGH